MTTILRSPRWQFTPGRGEHGRTIPLADLRAIFAANITGRTPK